MKRLLVIAVLLSACSCSHTPVASAQHDLLVIRKDYDRDLHDQAIYCNVHISCDAVQTAQYRASASLFTADSERTSKALSKARDDVAAFTKALQQ